MRKDAEERAVLPACLLVAGRPCLVVGGGKIAARKVGHLLEARADVTVVSPDAVDELRDAAARGRLRHLAREFSETDVSGQTVVFAVTDKEAVNRRVIDCCKARDVLCSAADGNWPRGDFVTPAIHREGGVTVTVSTGGRSCRLARVIKDKLAPVVRAILAGEHGEQS